MGNSPRHARSVANVFSLTTGLVSPQFHVQFDDFFKTVKSGYDITSTPSIWQSLAGFTKHPQHHINNPSSQQTPSALVPSHISQAKNPDLTAAENSEQKNIE